MDRLLTRRAPRSSRAVAVQAASFGRTGTAMMMFALLLVLVTAMAAMAQKASAPYEPQVGQAGKDVVWVPTPQALVDRMLDMAKATPSDYLIDLGSGDGRTVITAAKRGLTAKGIEYNPKMVEVAVAAAKAAGVSDKATFENADLFESDLSKAQIITMFLLPWINEKLSPTLLTLKPGTRIVSNTFTMGEWQPDETASVAAECVNYCKALLWIVPAKAEGIWRLGEAELKLKQSYQMLSGTLGPTEITDARMKGNEISFTVGNVSYTGVLDGKSMSGTVSGGSNATWTATMK